MDGHEPTDLDELVKTCHCLKEYFTQTNNSERKSVEVFLALFKKSLELIDAELDSSQLVFDAKEICDASYNSKEDYAAAKEFIIRHKKGFDKFVKDNIEEITHFCSLNNVRYIPTIKNTSSSGGHRTYFYIGLNAVSDSINHRLDLKPETSVRYESTSITYTIPKLPKPVTWAKPLLDLQISGWKFYVYVGLPLVAIFIAYFLFYWNYLALTKASLVFSAVVIFIFSLVYVLMKPFYEAMNKRVAIAPLWLTKLDVQSAQIRAVRTEHKRKNGKHIRALQIVLYKAKCPICGHDVFIEKGKLTHKGRLIGVCDESPREHIFSFDHITKKGSLLRG